MLIIARHGSTDLNETGLLQGTSLASLSAVGRAQAQALARELGARGVSPGSVVCSNLPRAQETAEAVAARLSVQLRVEPDLRERDFGRFEGMHRTELERERDASGLDNFDPTQDWDGFPGVEWDSQIMTRVDPILVSCGLPASAATTDTLIVTHAGVMKAVLHAILQIPVERRRAIKTPPGSFVTFDYDSGHLQLTELWRNPEQ